MVLNQSMIETYAGSLGLAGSGAVDSSLSTDDARDSLPEREVATDLYVGVGALALFGTT